MSDEAAATEEERSTSRRRVAVWVGAPIMAMTLVGGVLGLALSDGDSSLLAYALVVGAALLVSALAVALVLTVGQRSDLLRAGPIWSLPFRDRWRVGRALRRGGAPPPGLRDEAIRVADDIAGRRGLGWLFLGIAALQAFNALVQDGWVRWFLAFSAVMFVALAALWRRQQRQAREALHRWTAADAETEGSNAS